MSDWYCPICGRERHDLPDGIATLFHRCKGERTTRPRSITVGTPTLEERKSELFYALTDAMPEEALRRR